MKWILIVDDEPSIRFSLARCLQSASVSVISCNDSATARQVIADGGIDVVITDMRLSPVNTQEGVEFVGYLRSRPERLPVIVVSGSEELGTRAMQQGADCFFPKPVDMDRLIGVLQNMGLQVGP
jgi:DNA-binding NtrC family response regulator